MVGTYEKKEVFVLLPKQLIPGVWLLGAMAFPQKAEKGLSTVYKLGGNKVET